MTKTALITGASGFLGRYAALEWARAGFRVIGIGREAWGESEWRACGLSDWVCGDVTVESLAALAGYPEVVVPCAGSGAVGFSYQDPVEDFGRTVGTLLATLEYIRLRVPNAKLVYPSSAAVYGLVCTLPIGEEAALAPASPYGNHKLIAEMLCRSYAQHFGLNVAIVRFFSIYGENLRKQLLWDACNKFSAGQALFPGTGEEIRDWVHVTDATKLLRTVAEHASPDCIAVNGASGQGHSVREILSILKTAFPATQALDFTGIAKVGDPSAYIGNSLKAKALGWHPTVELTDGIRSYSDWYLSEQA